MPADRRLFDSSSMTPPPEPQIDAVTCTVDRNPLHDKERATGDKISEPDWNAGTRCHNWRGYVSARVRDLWPTFTDEQKLALYEQADEAAGNEYWD